MSTNMQVAHILDKINYKVVASIKKNICEVSYPTINVIEPPIQPQTITYKITNNNVYIKGGDQDKFFAQECPRWASRTLIWADIHYHCHMIGYNTSMVFVKCDNEDCGMGDQYLLTTLSKPTDPEVLKCEKDFADLIRDAVLNDFHVFYDNVAEALDMSGPFGLIKGLLKLVTK